MNALRRTVEIIEDIIGNEIPSDVKFDKIRLIEDLGMDSLDIVELSLRLEEELCFTGETNDWEKWVTVRDVLAYVKAKKS